MATRTHPIFMNLNAGELSPKLEGRLDLTRYHNGVHRMRNWICLPQGGARTRFGTHFVAEVKDSTKETGLLPFQYSEYQNYMIEVGDLYMRFFMDCGQIMTTSGAELITNGAFAAGITGWTDLSTGTGAISWDTDHMEITGGATGVGCAEQGITTAIGSIYYLSFDVTAFPLTVRIGITSGGNEILDDTVYAVGTSQVILFMAYATTTYIQFKTADNNLAELDNVSCKLGIPYEIVTPYTEDDIWGIRGAQSDEYLYLVHGDHPPQFLTRTDHDAWAIGDMVFTDGPYEDEISTPTITPSAAFGAITLTASAPLFLPGHVGALWRIKHGAASWGYVKITGYTSSTVVSADVMSDLAGVGPYTGHREGAWSDVNGWPRVVCFHEGRLLFASNYEWPNTIWASKAGNEHYGNFTPGTLDDDAYTYTLSDINILRWMKSARMLCVGALDGESTLVGPSDGPITATSPPRVKSQTTHGSASVESIKIGKAILFLQKAERKIREFAYTYEDDAYAAPDISVLSDHLMINGILDMAYQQEPYSIIYAVDGIGDLLGCTYDRSQDVVGWHLHQTDGSFECVKTIPYANEDQVWVVVQRLINGVAKRYIEYLDINLCTDCSLVYSGPEISTIYGLAHLVGKEVQIVGDGAPYPPQTVPATGILIIDPPASEIYLGLFYTPTLTTNSGTK